MKKFILMSVTVFIFGLVSCGKTDRKTEEDKKEDCEQDATKEWKGDECVDKEEEEEVAYTITNKSDDTVIVATGKASVNLSNDECVKVTKSEFAKLKVSLEGSWWLAADKTLCGDPTGTACSADNYNVQREKKTVTIVKPKGEPTLVPADKNSKCDKRIK